MRFFSLLCVALTVGCGGTVVAQQVEPQPGSPAKEQSPAVATGGQPKEVVNSIGLKLLLIPAGTFTMGSPASEKDRYDTETQHQVTLQFPSQLVSGVTRVDKQQIAGCDINGQREELKCPANCCSRQSSISNEVNEEQNR